jgi:hypothetical protein
MGVWEYGSMGVWECNSRTSQIIRNLLKNIINALPYSHTPILPYLLLILT